MGPICLTIPASMAGEKLEMQARGENSSELGVQGGGSQRCDPQL